MEFGSERTLSFVNRYLDTGDAAAYDELYAIVYRDSQQLLRRWRIQAYDADDLIQEIEMSVFQHIVTFAIAAADNSISQRNAWLKTIIRNKVFDFFRKERPRITNTDPKAIEDIFDLFDKAYGADERLELKEAVFQSLKILFSLKTAPEKMMCFLMAKLSSTGTNGSVQEICERVNGRTLIEVFYLTKRTIEEALGYAVPDDVFQGLLNQIEDKRDATVDVSVRRITDTSSWIVTKMRLKKDE